MPVPTTAKLKPNRKSVKPAKLEALTLKQQEFIAALAADPKMCATDAAMKVYACKSRANASKIASQCLANPTIKAALDHAVYKRLWGYEVTADRVIREVACLAFSDPAELYAADGVTPLHPCKMTPETRRAVKSVRVSYTESMDEVGNFNQVRNVEANMADKTVPLQMLMRNLGIDGTTKIQGQLDANITGGVSVQLDLGQILLDLEKSRVVDADSYQTIEAKEQADGRQETDDGSDQDDSAGEG